MKLKPKTQATQLTAMAKIGTGPPPAKVRQCRICLIDEEFSPTGKSSLDKGICADREACEERQPPLIALDEIP